jgi:ribonuclease P protein component
MGKKVYHLFPFAVYYKYVSQSDTPGIAVAFAVPKKRFKHSVDRNRIKRLCKEAYRLNKHELYAMMPSPKAQLLLFFMFNGKEIPNFELVKARICGFFPLIAAALPAMNAEES